MTTTIAVFDTHQAASDAVEKLKANEVPSEQISYVQRTGVTELPVEVDENTVTGTGVGAIAGLVLTLLALPAYPIIVAGPIATVLGVATGTALGAAAGGLLGALVDLGLSQQEAEAIAERVEAGDVLVVAQTEAGQKEAMTEAGAAEVYLVE
jgi:outer membrane lipoprotein SlyB